METKYNLKMKSRVIIVKNLCFLLARIFSASAYDLSRKALDSSSSPPFIKLARTPAVCSLTYILTHGVIENMFISLGSSCVFFTITFWKKLGVYGLLQVNGIHRFHQQKNLTKSSYEDPTMPRWCQTMVEYKKT